MSTPIFTLVCLCPHPITVVLASGEHLTIPPSGIIARVAQSSRQVDRTCDMTPGEELQLRTVEIAVPEYGEVTGLPDRQEGVAFVVSQMVALASPRADLLYPDSGPDAIREGGQIVAVRRLLRWPHKTPPVLTEVLDVVTVDGRAYEIIRHNASECIIRLVIPLTDAEVASDAAERERVYAIHRGERGTHLDNSHGGICVGDPSCGAVQAAFAALGIRYTALKSHGDPHRLGMLVRLG